MGLGRSTLTISNATSSQGGVSTSRLARKTQAIAMTVAPMEQGEDQIAEVMLSTLDGGYLDPFPRENQSFDQVFCAADVHAL